MRHSAVLFASIISISLAACGGSQKDQSSDVISESNTEVKVISDSVNHREKKVTSKIVSKQMTFGRARSVPEGTPIIMGADQ